MHCSFVRHKGLTFAGRPLVRDEQGVQPRELSILKYCAHPYILKVHEIQLSNFMFLCETPTMTMRTFMAKPEISSGNLRKSILHETAIGLAYLHRHGIAHLNLNTDTVVLTKVMRPNRKGIEVPHLHAVLTSFENARFVQDPAEPFQSTNYVPYQSLELLKGHGKVAFTHDIYSYGILLFNCIRGRELKRNLLSTDLVEALEKEPNFSFIEAGLGDKVPGDRNVIIQLIAGCMNLSPQYRFKIDDVINHEFFDDQDCIQRRIDSLEVPAPQIPVPVAQDEKRDNMFRNGLKWIANYLATNHQNCNARILFKAFDTYYRYQPYLGDDNRAYQAAMAALLLVMKTYMVKFDVKGILASLTKVYKQAILEKIYDMEESIIDQVEGEVIRINDLYERCVSDDDLTELYEYSMDRSVISRYRSSDHREFLEKHSNKGDRKDLATIASVLGE